MQDLTRIGTVVVLGLFAILSFSAAARGHQDLVYWCGLGFFVFCILLAFYAIAQLTSPHKSHGRH